MEVCRCQAFAALFAFAGLLCIVIPVAALFYRRHGLDMKRHLQRIGTEGQHGAVFDPAARS